jgi:uncharacterized protein YigE (DUF2233 family)
VSKTIKSTASHPAWGVAVAALIAALLACGAPVNQPATSPPQLTPTPIPTLPVIPPTSSALIATPTVPPIGVEDIPEGEWLEVMPGLDVRSEFVGKRGILARVEMIMVRVDPARYAIRTHYGLDNTASVTGWHQRVGGYVVINGAFFEPRETVLGALIEDGVVYGQPFVDHGGMLSIQGSQANVRSLAQQPWLPGEAIQYAIQGRPMLVYAGGEPVNFDLSPEGSRRTVVAQDAAGRIVLMVNDYGALSLYALRDWLATNRDLDILAAFNLDGGGSTGMVIDAPELNMTIDSWWPVATALSIQPRESND